MSKMPMKRSDLVMERPRKAFRRMGVSAELKFLLKFEQKLKG